MSTPEWEGWAFYGFFFGIPFTLLFIVWFTGWLTDSWKD